MVCGLPNVLSIKGLLHYPTCKAQLEVSAWSEVGRTRDLPQMTHVEIGKSGNREIGIVISQPAVFGSRAAISPFQLTKLDLLNCIIV